MIGLHVNVSGVGDTPEQAVGGPQAVWIPAAQQFTHRLFDARQHQAFAHSTQTTVEFEQAFHCGTVEVRTLFKTEDHDAQVIATLNAGHDICHHPLRAGEEQWLFRSENQQTGNGGGTLMSVEHHEVS